MCSENHCHFHLHSDFDFDYDSDLESDHELPLELPQRKGPSDCSLSADPMELTVRGDVGVVDGAHSDDVHHDALGRVVRAVYGVDGVHLRSAMD